MDGAELNPFKIKCTLRVTAQCLQQEYECEKEETKNQKAAEERPAGGNNLVTCFSNI